MPERDGRRRREGRRKGRGGEISPLCHF